MSRQKHRSQLDAIDEINMTPLIDLSFMLLIVFMITAPLLEYAIDVSPPEMNAEKLPDENVQTINLDKNGQIIYHNSVISAPDLVRELAALYGVNNKTTIMIRADGARPYSEVMAVMKAVKEAGVKNISLITQAEGN
jgi:biopolymer transport protein ExbD